MLETKNLTKTYRSKGGVEVHALDNVSIRFPEKGMVFLLGKSGSGKSTLLNLCGGLDNPTSGEVIVKGRSSADFSQSDFDSYRNTFIGFIFQEYNILNEFSVEDNIALALELQGKSKDKKAIQDLLEQVDLTGYAKRKPNTLSGGQKQRIAIARALIKNPEIIMADEPTGALDSNTGKQVFDTLKKLSQEKLVIIVSHDREFAEIYADRIVELKDGKILSDVSKVHEESASLSENVKVVGEKTLQIKDTKNLSESDFALIKDFLKNNQGETVLTTGEKEVADFKKMVKITDDGQQEVFKPSVENTERKTYTKEESKFIRSKLPGRHAMKIGASSLKVKPVRLIFTILLSVASFAMFGISSTLMTYDGKTAFANTLRDSSYDTVRIEKRYLVTNKYYENGKLDDTDIGYATTKFTQDEVNSFCTTFGKNTFGTIDFSENINNLKEQSKYYYYTNEFKYLATVPAGHPMRENLLQGTYPVDEAEGELPQIMISDYIANGIIDTGLKNPVTNTEYTFTNLSSVIGKTLEIDHVKYTVSGIFKGETIPSEYDTLKEARTGTSAHYELARDYVQFLTDSTNLVAFVTQNTLETVASTSSSDDWDVFYQYFNYNRSARCLLNTEDFPMDFEPESWYMQYNWTDYTTAQKIGGITFFDHNKTSLLQGEIIVNKPALMNMLSDAYYFYDNIYCGINNAMNEFTDNAPTITVAEFEDELIANGYETTNNPETDNEYYNACNQWKEAYDNLQLYPEDENWKSNYEYALSLTVPCTEVWNYHDTKKTEYVEYYQDWQELKELAGKTYNTMQKFNMNATVEGKKYTLSDAVQYLYNGDPTFYDVTINSERNFTKEEIAEIPEVVENAVKAMAENTKCKMQGYVNGQTTSALKEFKVVGYFSLNSNYCVMLSDEDYALFKEAGKDFEPNWHTEYETKYETPEGAIYSSVFLDYDHSERMTELIKRFSDYQADDSYFAVNNSIADMFNLINSFVEDGKTVFLYIGIGLALFAALLLSNFISVSISYKKREIGILRAVGARSADVFKIFFSESFVITAICIVLATVATMAACVSLNIEFCSKLGISLFDFKLISFLSLCAVAIGTAFIATFLPVFFTSRKKPVESIRAL